jgi:MFS family permease
MVNDGMRRPAVGGRGSPPPPPGVLGRLGSRPRPSAGVGARPVPAFVTPAFLTAAVGNFLFFTSLSAFFLLPLHLKQLGVTEGQIGIIMGLYSAAAIFGQPVVGVWVDRWGRRPFLLLGAALAMLASALFAVAPAIVLLFPALRVLQGLAYSLYFVANFTLVVDLVPAGRRGQALGVFGISGLVSTAIGPALGEVVAQRLGFRAFFAATAAVASLALLVSSRVSEPPLRRPTGGAGFGGLLRDVLSAPARPMALGFAFGLGLGVMFTFLPTYAQSLGVTRIGLFAVAYSVAAMTVRAAAGRLIDRAGRRAIILPALAIQALAALLLSPLAALARQAGLSPLPGLGLAGLLAGTAHGFLYPALSALVMDLAPEERRGRVIGVFSAFILSGNATGAMTFGYLARAFGYGPMFALLGVLLSGACMLARRLER